MYKRQVLKRLKPIAEAKNIELVFESFRPVIADVDQIKFASVATNLVENAIKYNNTDGTVTASLNSDHQYFYLKVTDTGIGISEEDQKRVFDRFYRVDKARSRETGGTGLGLAITKDIVLKHHGSIKIHSKEGEGTTFTVRIPVSYTHLRAHETRHDLVCRLLLEKKKKGKKVKKEEPEREKVQDSAKGL